MILIPLLYGANTWWCRIPGAIAPVYKDEALIRAKLPVVQKYVIGSEVKHLSVSDLTEVNN